MKNKNEKNGFTLPIVLIVLLIMTILGFSTLSLTSSQSKFNVIDDSTKKAMEYAEAGYNKYLWHLNDDLNFYSTEQHDEMMYKPIEFEDGYFMLDVTRPSDVDRFVTIKSTGWTKDNPTIKKTIIAKIRKKQFVHHVYVSDNDGKIWWTSGDESHGPYHTNGDMNIQNSPEFYDVVSYKGSLNFGSSYSPNFFIDKKEPYRPKNSNESLSYLYKTEELGFPETNQQLKDWAEKDDMVFKGRTFIYLDGDNVKIRNQNSDEIKNYSILHDIPNMVIYVDKETDKNIKGSDSSKFGIKSGNVFVSGKLKGRLTIGAEDRIYITHDDPTNWYDYNPNDIYNENKKPNQPPEQAPLIGGIEYSNTRFGGNSNGIGNNMSSFNEDKSIWTRYALGVNSNKPGKDMLGLIANNDILILHYGWPKKALDQNKTDDYWNSVWEKKYTGYIFRRFDKWELSSKSSTKYDVAPKNINIHAAVFSVKEGFGYEDYSKGIRKGDINLWGNITQKTRKAVGTIGSTGYNKKYAHDPRMFYDYPPHILEPTNVGWEIHEWKETNDHLIEKP